MRSIYNRRLCADVRAPTPSAAAELVAPDLSEMVTALDGIRRALIIYTARVIEQKEHMLRSLTHSLRYLGPQVRLNNDRQRVDQLNDRLERAIFDSLNDANLIWRICLRGCRAVSPHETLARGYAIVRDDHGHIVRSASLLQRDQQLNVQFLDGDATVTVADLPPT